MRNSIVKRIPKRIPVKVYEKLDREQITEMNAGNRVEGMKDLWWENGEVYLVTIIGGEDEASN